MKKLSSTSLLRNALSMMSDGGVYPDTYMYRKSAPEGLSKGSLITQIRPAENTASILNSKIAPEYQGLGLGKKMYGRSIDAGARAFARGNGMKWLESGSSTSDMADRVWQSLIRKGYPIEDKGIQTAARYRVNLAEVAKLRKYIPKI